MAPEVIEHNPYREKADVFSFGITMWELLTARVPYEQMTPLQAAVGVVQKGLRPTIPPACPEALAALLRDCWQKDPRERPPFEALKVRRPSCSVLQEARPTMGSSRVPFNCALGTLRLSSRAKDAALCSWVCDASGQCAMCGFVLAAWPAEAYQSTCKSSRRLQHDWV